MLRLLPFGLALVALLSSPMARAADDDDDETLGEDSDDTETKPKSTRIEADDDLDTIDPLDDDGWLDEKKSTTIDPLDSDIDDEFGTDSSVEISGPGVDSSRIYREQLLKVEKLAPDEEALSWERYLKKYDNSLFKSRIGERLDELSQTLYEDRIEGHEGDRVKDAGKAEIRFAQPLQLENIDPRTKFRAGFEWGFPSTLNFVIDGEYAPIRQLSFHAGLRSRFTGMGLDFGGRYALIKSARTKTLVTGIMDFRLNFNPMWTVPVGFRPQVAVGQRFKLPFGHLDAQLQGGTELIFENSDAGKMLTEPRIIGGANVSLAPTENIRVYMETSSYMKDVFDDTFPGFFRFNVVTFGLKYVQRKSATKDRFEAGIGASAPYSSQYWRFHTGSVMGDMNYYL